MGNEKKKIKDNAGSYNERCECDSASTKGYMAHFGVQKYPKILKGIPEKRKTAVFSQAD